MRSEVEIDTERPEELREILAPSLEADDKVGYDIETNDSKLTVATETDGIGPLRGSTDTVFRLASLALKLY